MTLSSSRNQRVGLAQVVVSVAGLPGAVEIKRGDGCTDVDIPPRQRLDILCGGHLRSFYGEIAPRLQVDVVGLDGGEAAPISL